MEITKTTEPTLQTVLAALEAGKLKETAQNYSNEDLAEQLFTIHPTALRYREQLAEKGWPNIEELVVQSHRLLEITGYAVATHIGVSVDVMAQGTLQQELRKDLIANRDAIVRLAREAGVAPQLFSVNFGRGNASNVLPGALAFRTLLDKHGDKLGDSPLVREIIEEVNADVEALINAESSQEAGKQEKLLPTDLRRRASNALYANLLTISRIGFAVFRKDEDLRAQFRLRVLHRSETPAVAIDDDDAPVVPVTSDEAGVTVPQGTPAGTTLDDVADLVG